MSEKAPYLLKVALNSCDERPSAASTYITAEALQKSIDRAYHSGYVDGLWLAACVTVGLIFVAGCIWWIAAAGVTP